MNDEKMKKLIDISIKNKINFKYELNELIIENDRFSIYINDNDYKLFIYDRLNEYYYRYYFESLSYIKDDFNFKEIDFIILKDIENIIDNKDDKIKERLKEIKINFYNLIESINNSNIDNIDSIIDIQELNIMIQNLEYREKEVLKWKNLSEVIQKMIIQD